MIFLNSEQNLSLTLLVGSKSMYLVRGSCRPNYAKGISGSHMLKDFFVHGPTIRHESSIRLAHTEKVCTAYIFYSFFDTPLLLFERTEPYNCFKPVRL